MNENMNQREIVDKYAELAEKKKKILEEIDLEMEKLRKEIVSYAKENNIEIMFGSNKKLSIKFFKNFKFPSRNSEQRKQLDNLLKQLNKWEEISTLDTFVLNKMIKEEKWPKEILDKIKDFGKFEEMPRLSLRDKQDLVVG